jgi:hypothetical protein
MLPAGYEETGTTSFLPSIQRQVLLLRLHLQVACSLFTFTLFLGYNARSGY